MFILKKKLKGKIHSELFHFDGIFNKMETKISSFI